MVDRDRREQFRQAQRYAMAMRANERSVSFNDGRSRVDNNSDSNDEQPPPKRVDRLIGVATSGPGIDHRLAIEFNSLESRIARLPLDVVRYCINPYLGVEPGSLKDNTLSRFRLHEFKATGTDPGPTYNYANDNLLLTRGRRLALIRDRHLYQFDLDTDQLVCAPVELELSEEIRGDMSLFRPWSVTASNQILCAYKHHALFYGLDGRLVRQVELRTAGNYNVYDVHESPNDGRLFAIASGEVCIFNPSGALNFTIQRSVRFTVCLLRLAPRQGFFVVDGSDHRIRVYSMTTGALIYHFPLSIIKGMREYETGQVAIDNRGNMAVMVKGPTSGACFVHDQLGDHICRVDAIATGLFDVASAFEMRVQSRNAIDELGHLWISDEANSHWTIKANSSGHLVNLRLAEFY